MSDKTIVLLMGIIAGMLLCLMSGLLFIAAGQPVKETNTTQAPTDAVIEAAIAEDFVNRAFMQSVAGGAGAWTIQDGRVDIQPAGRLQFSVRVKSPIGTLLLKGAVRITAQSGQLAIHITEARLGQLPLTGALKPFLPSLEAQINKEAHRQLNERAAMAKIQLVGVTSDETHLRFHFAGQR